MSKLMNVLCTSLCAFTLNTVQGDDVGMLPEQDNTAPLSAFELPSISTESPPIDSIQAPSDPASFSPMPEPAAPELKPTPQTVAEKPKAPFKPFSGKVKGKRVRLRAQPDLDSSVVQELPKGEVLLVTGEAEDFWIVEPPSGMKAFVSRKFVLDNVVEGNRVNVRLQPTLESPVLAHLNSGDKVDGNICSANAKWVEMSMPSSVRFYVAKNYIENIGSPEVKAMYETRLRSAEQLLLAADYLAEMELQKNFSEIDLDKVSEQYLTIINDYQDFPVFVEKAQESLAHAQEMYVDKKISYSESKQEEEALPPSEAAVSAFQSITDKMKLWEPVEEALYLSWATVNDSRSCDDYYSEQKMAATEISGIIEPYLSPVKCKPGDYIIRENDLPVAYVYSTVVNLQDFVGKKVKLTAASRPNNNFAFPAYFVLAVE